MPVVAPEALASLYFDSVVMLVAYLAAAQVKEQLLKLGVSEDKILFYDEYIASRHAGEYTIYDPKSPVKLALVSVALNYNGGTMAIISAALALIQFGYSVTIVVPAADMKLVAELNDFGISVAVYPAFCNMGKKELEWLRCFDFAIVNVLQKIDCAIKISGEVPMLWWLHETSDKYNSIYPNTLARWKKYLNDDRIQKVPVFAVSPVAERAFHNYFPDVSTKLLPYCVKDEGMKAIDNEYKKQIITFALVGFFSERKQQKLFLAAAKKLNESHGDRLRFCLVGKAGDDTYSREVIALAEQIPNVELTGVLSREQMADLYKNEIDVVVCPSLEECLPTVITECIMHSRICIVSDNAGMSEYILDGVNGFVCKTGDVDSLCQKMLYVINHFNELGDMRREARITYEKNFTMDVFARRMDAIIKDIMKITA